MTKHTIPFEAAESAKNLVGKTLARKDGKEVEITEWNSDNEYIITDTASGKQGNYPVMTILDAITREMFTVKK